MQKNLRNKIQPSYRDLLDRIAKCVMRKAMKDILYKYLEQK